MATLMAFDYGHKKIGVAIGQIITGTSSPLVVVANDRHKWSIIDKLMTTWQPQGVVIGQPFLADGKPHPLEKMIETFINTLKTRYNIEIYRENEAFTSLAARQYQLRSKCQKAVDSVAAALFLESWMRNNSTI